MRPAMRGEPAARFQPPGWLARATSATGPQVTYAGRSLARRPLLTAATVRGAYLQSCGPQALGHRRRRPWRPVRTPYFALDGSGSSCGNAGRHSGEPVPTRTEEVRGSNPLTSTPTKTQVTGLAGSPPPGRRRSRPPGRAANGQRRRRCVAVLRMVGVEGRASGEASSVMARPGIGVGVRCVGDLDRRVAQSKVIEGRVVARSAGQVRQASVGMPGSPPNCSPRGSLQATGASAWSSRHASRLH
jgi:hypothetical protein